MRDSASPVGWLPRGHRPTVFMKKVPNSSGTGADNFTSKGPSGRLGGSGSSSLLERLESRFLPVGPCS